MTKTVNRELINYKTSAPTFRSGLNNAIDATSFAYCQKKSFDLKKSFGLENNIVLGHVGNFSYVKNYPFLLSVFQKTKEKCPKCKLVLIGNGSLRGEIETLAKQMNIFDDIMFLGVRSDVPDLLQMIDVFVFPSLFEGLPVTLVEAQVSGLKIFASDSITREVALTEDIDFLSIKESPEYWANKILTSVPYERKSNYQIIKEKGYDIEENVCKLQEFYLEQITEPLWIENP